MFERGLMVIGFLVAITGLAVVTFFDVPGLVGSVAVVIGILLVGWSSRAGRT